MTLQKSTLQNPPFETVQPLEGEPRKAYQQPRILSWETLEAMGGNSCSPPSEGCSGFTDG